MGAKREIIELRREQVVAFRTARHGLAKRRGRAALAEAATPAGLRRTKDTAMAFGARVKGATAGDMTRALDEKRLVATFGARGTVMVVRPADLRTFTLGVAPADEESYRAISKAFLPALDRAGFTIQGAVELVADAAAAALARGPMDKADLARAVTRAIPPALSPPCRGRCPDPHVEDLLFRQAGVTGVMCFEGASERLVAVDDWLGRSPTTSRSKERGAFVRRYLGTYGPSTANSLAEWAGISLADARRSLDHLADETVDARIDGRRGGVMLQQDAGTIARERTPEGVRALPAFDAFLLDRDRETLIPDRATQKAVWKSAANPRVLLVDGEVVATWTSRKERGRVTITLAALSPALPADYEIEAELRLVLAATGSTDPIAIVHRDR